MEECAKDAFVFPRVIRHHENANNADDTSVTTMTTGGSSNDWADPTDYLTGFHFAPIHQQSHKLVDRVFEIHSQTMPGVTRERADAGYLETASKLPLYGASAARVIQDMMIGVSATGITGAYLPKLGRNLVECMYRVTHQAVANLPLTSKQQFRFGLARPGQARTVQAKTELCFEVSRRFATT